MSRKAQRGGRSAALKVLPAVLWAATAMAFSGELPSAPLATNAPGLASDRFLGADGSVFRDHRGRGQIVQLRGVNLGGWLEWQSWMCPLDSSKTLRDGNPGHNGYNFEVRDLLVRRFGQAQADYLIDAYLTAWISHPDLDRIQSLGLNSVRLPLAYDTFLHNDGTWRSNAFQYVDWLVTNAWQHGLYTILDYHAFLPPAANQDGSAAGYWSNPSQKVETIRIWRRIAERYRNNPAVAMYDLLNEPGNSTPKGRTEPSPSVVCELYDQLYQAIRAVDPDHLVVMEGMWDWKTLRHPGKSAYRNVVYSFHWYHWGAKSTQEHHRLTDEELNGVESMWQVWDVPVLIGEFNFFGDWNAWEHALEHFRGAGLSWSLWTFKNKAVGNNSWGLLTTIPGQAPRVPDLTTDSAQTIREAWQAWKTSPAIFAFNPNLKRLLTQSVPQSTNRYAQAASPRPR